MKIENYKNQKEFFQRISLKQRNSYLKQVFSRKQIQQKFEPFYAEYCSLQTWNFNGFQLKYHLNQNTKTPKAILIYIHGLNSHGGTSGYLAKVVSEKLGNDVNITALDLKNYGRSKGQQKDYGYWENFDQLVEQVEEFSNFIRNKYSSKPRIFLAGMSMGGLIVYKAGLANKYNYSGIIFFSPALRDHPADGNLLKNFACLAAIFPRMPAGLADFSKDTRYNLIEYEKNDPFKISDRQLPGIVGYRLLQAMKQASSSFEQFNLPYLLFQSGVDKYVDVFAPIDLQRESKSEDKTTVYYKDAWHSLDLEPECQDMCKKIVVWLRQRI